MTHRKFNRSEKAFRRCCRWGLAAVTLGAVLLAGCSIKKLAVNKIGNSLANSGTTFSADDDPDLVGDALPFSLKLMESLLAESPKLKKALAIDPDVRPEWRLNNLVTQRCARGLLERESELFLAQDTGGKNQPTNLAISLQGKW